ncbi:MAG: HNH endonuclease [Clostridia bacterium]|nr:HNH endonuclease [Clostridia bacterium]
MEKKSTAFFALFPVQLCLSTERNGPPNRSAAALLPVGYDSRWREARKLCLQLHPLCVKCLEEKKITPATVVDHIVPHRGDQKLFWDQSNWQPLCKRHHDEKTGKGL